MTGGRRKGLYVSEVGPPAVGQGPRRRDVGPRPCRDDVGGIPARRGRTETVAVVDDEVVLLLVLPGHDVVVHSVSPVRGGGP